MDKIVKEFNGHSGSKVFLKENDSGLYVEKIGNTIRNQERMSVLYNAGYPVPKVYRTNGDEFCMEYIHGLDMKNYLIHNNIVHLQNFIHKTLDSFSSSFTMKDYTNVYEEKLEWLPDDFIFTKKQIISKLPKYVAQSVYHGDLTLENIIHTNTGFTMIDPVTIEYDSYVFDIAKMRQDLECKWFLRNSDVRLDTKLQNIQDGLRKKYPYAFDDYILIMMLLRVLKHCEKGDDNYLFLMKEIKRLWK